MRENIIGKLLRTTKCEDFSYYMLLVHVACFDFNFTS